MKSYTINQLAREKLLINAVGNPCDKAKISRLVRKIDFVEVETPYGKAKTITAKQVRELNKKLAKVKYRKNTLDRP